MDMGESELEGPLWSQQEIKVVPGATWWWISWAAISFLALVLNIIFLAIVIRNRKTRDFRSLLTASLVTISVLDILDIGRIVPSIITNLHIYTEFRIVYCSVGIFHHIAVALLLILIGVYLVCPCRDAPPLYYPASRCSGSLPQKLLIPLILALGAGTAGLLPLLQDVFASIVDRDNMVPHSCIDPTRVMTLIETGHDTDHFWSDLYHSLVTVTTAALPLLIIPPTLVVATVRACVHGHCCQLKYKQSAGEVLLVLLVTLTYLGSIVGSVLPHLDARLDQFSVQLEPVPVLWEIGNAAARPAIYFLTNPAVWEGLKSVCCTTRRSYGSLSTKEDEVALSPVVERISSL